MTRRGKRTDKHKTGQQYQWLGKEVDEGGSMRGWEKGGGYISK